MTLPQFDQLSRAAVEAEGLKRMLQLRSQRTVSTAVVDQQSAFPLVSCVPVMGQGTFMTALDGLTKLEVLTGMIVGAIATSSSMAGSSPETIAEKAAALARAALHAAAPQPSAETDRAESSQDTSKTEGGLHEVQEQA